MKQNIENTHKVQVKNTETKSEQNGMGWLVSAGDECDSNTETTLGLMKFYSLSVIGTQKFSAVNTFTAIVDLSRFNNSCLKSRQRRP